MNVTIDQSDLLSVRVSMLGIKNGVPKVMSRSVNKTLSGIRTDAVGAVADDLNLTKTRIRKDFKIRKATIAWPEGQVTSTGRPVGLAAFRSTRQVKRGVSVKVKKRGPRKILKHAFIATAKNAKHVFWRDYSGPRTKGEFVNRYGTEFPAANLPYRYRYPVERLTGPRIQDILADKKVDSKIEKLANARLLKAIDHEVSYLLRTL